MPALTVTHQTVMRAFLFLLVFIVSSVQAFDQDALLQQLEEARVRHGIAGVSIALVTRDRVLYVGGLGHADRTTQRPVDADTLFRIGSITKMFTGVAMLIGEADGLFSLNDPVSMHVREVPVQNAWEKTHPIRIAHLLEHTAGLTDLTKKEFDSSDPKPLTILEALDVDRGSRQLRWPPGMHSSYSNTGAGIAAHVLELRSGKSYESFVKQRIFEPLEMRSAGFELTEDVRQRLATGYDSDGTTAMPYWHVLYRAFGGINASARDMAHFTQWLLNRGGQNKKTLTEAQFDRLEQPRTTLAARTGLTYGYGLGVYAYAHRGQLFYGHSGDADGYLSRLGYNKETGLGYFFAINAYKSDALSAMQAIIENAITRNAKRRLRPPMAAVSTDKLESLAGCYVPFTHRFVDSEEGNDDALLIRVKGDYLTSTPKQGLTRPLFPVTEQHFRRNDEPVATSAFVQDENGDMFLQGDMGNLKRVTGAEATQHCQH